MPGRSRVVLHRLPMENLICSCGSGGDPRPPPCEGVWAPGPCDSAPVKGIPKEGLELAKREAEGGEA